MTSRRQFLSAATAFAATGGYMPSLWAAMKYDRKGVLDLFHLRAEDTEARVKAGVEANRKGPMLFTFKDKDGKILENVHVKVTQKTHDFRYGANLFMLDEFKEPERNAGYKDLFASAFNIATLPFYWSDLEPEQGRPRFAKDSKKIYRRPPPDLCLEFCEKRGIEPKAHILNYYTWPDWARGDVGKEKRLLAERMRVLGERYATRIPMWEVTNETLWGPESRLTNFYQQPDYIDWSFKTAEKYFPGNRLIINEAHCRLWCDPWFSRTRSPYYMQIENAIAKGARIDGVGLQFHMFFKQEESVRETRNFYDPQRIFDVMDTYAQLGRKLQITELTIPAYSYDPGDEEVQAEILRTLYRIWFSHPAMEAIIYWNLVDGYAAFAPLGDMTAGENYYHGGLIRHDFTPKPAFKVIQDLFQKEWRTAFTRDVGGRFAFRGFKGEYELEATANGKTVKKDFRISPDFSSALEITVA